VYWVYRTVVGNLDNRIKLYGDVKDTIYITANLTSPAILKVSMGTDSKTLQLPAGWTDVQVPLVPGYTPAFELSRHSATVARASGADAITTDARYPNLYYSTGSMRSMQPQHHFKLRPLSPTSSKS
jgi:glucan endo-1,3-alpha-glucosidase